MLIPGIRKMIVRLLYGLGYELRARAEKPDPPRTMPGDEVARRFEQWGRRNDLLLHMGCGPRILKGWCNIDRFYVHYQPYLKYYTDEFYPASIRGSIDDFAAFDLTGGPLPLPDNCADVVFHEDFLEHLNQKEQVCFLAETLRVLKPGGVHRINTPDLSQSMKEHSDFSKGRAGVFRDEWEKHGHENVLTYRMLEEMALLVGYGRVVPGKRDQSLALKLPREYRPDPKDRPEQGNLFVDLIK